MLLVYLQDKDMGQLTRLKELCGKLLTRNDWDVRVEMSAEHPSEISASIKEIALPSLFLLDNAEDDSLDSLVRDIRRQNASNYLILMLKAADDALEPRAPFYRVSGFLLKPVEEAKLGDVVEAVYEDFEFCGEYSEMFQVKIRNSVYPVPFNKILFFESFGKKIVVRTAAQEYSFYDSLERVASEAPDCFLRIHKSYCVNLRLVKTVNYAGMSVTMNDGSVVLVSRGCKSELKEKMRKMCAKTPQG